MQSAVAGVSVEIFSTTVSYSLSNIFGFDASLAGDTLFPPRTISADAIFPESSVNLIGISKSSFEYTNTSFLPSTEYGIFLLVPHYTVLHLQSGVVSTESSL